MKFLDLSFKAPEENLACDEVLLDNCENGGPEVLRFWESPVYFAVLGYSNKAASELHLANCEKDAVPVLRRPSGGGTVLQGPGCLNYALVLKIPPSGPLKTLKSSNDSVMEINRQAMASILGTSVKIEGITDLALSGIKFSGNAQRRLKSAFLFHGTFLYGFDISWISKYLAVPSLQPEYRENRPHEKFVGNISCPPEKIKSALRAVWNADQPAEAPAVEELERLIAEKYSLNSWNLKF